MDELIPEHSFRFSASQAARALSYFSFIIRETWWGTVERWGPWGEHPDQPPAPSPVGEGHCYLPPGTLGLQGQIRRKHPPHLTTAVAPGRGAWEGPGEPLWETPSWERPKPQTGFSAFK